MKILHLTFYFEPDLCAGSFRNTPLFKELKSQIGNDDFVHVVTTQPNRYSTYKTKAEVVESGKNYKIDRIKIPTHKSGLFDQAISFCVFFYNVIKLVRKEKYDIVLASSSRRFRWSPSSLALPAPCYCPLSGANRKSASCAPWVPARDW